MPPKITAKNMNFKNVENAYILPGEIDAELENNRFDNVKNAIKISDGFSEAQKALLRELAREVANKTSHEEIQKRYDDSLKSRFGGNFQDVLRIVGGIASMLRFLA